MLSVVCARERGYTATALGSPLSEIAMDTDSQSELARRSRLVLRQKLESLEQAGVQQLGRSTMAALSLVPQVSVVAEAPHETTPMSEPSLPASASRQSRRHPARQTEPEKPRQHAEAASPPIGIPSTASPSTASLATPAADRASSAPRTSDQRSVALRALRAEVAICRRCPELAETRTQTVFGVGNPSPRLCFLGEAPGADEDRQGEPFVGAAGKLLDKIIAACTLRREDVYILNVLKCRPPGNRTPLPEEIANCRTFFERQLEILQPEFICCLGAVAAQTLLRSTRPVGQLRGQFHEYRGSRVVVTYHPSYLLRSPGMKRHTWDDMKMLLQAMGIPVPTP